MISRRQALGTLAAAGWLAAVWCAALASERDSEGPEGFERERVYSIPVAPSTGRGFGIERVVVDVGGRAVGIDGQAGIARESQDRIRLRSVPVIGKLFADRFSKSDFTPEKRVGEAFIRDRTLLVALAPSARGLWFDTVTVVHDKYSYRFQGSPAETTAPQAGDGHPVGEAFRREDTLLILIRPSIITDSLL